MANTGDGETPSTQEIALEVVRAELNRQPIQVTTGAGIAIAGAWLGASAITITMLLIQYVFNPMTSAEEAKMDFESIFFLVLLIASPMIAAYSITKVILSRD